MTPPDHELPTERVRRTLGRLGDQALPAPDFDELHLAAVAPGQPSGGPRWRRPVAALALVLVSAVAAVAIGLVLTGGDGPGDRVETDDPASAPSVGDDADTDGGVDPDADPESGTDGTTSTTGPPPPDGAAPTPAPADDEPAPDDQADQGPATTPDELLALADRLGADRLAVDRGDGTLVVVDGGQAREVAAPPGWLWSDGRFIYGVTFEGGEDVAMTFDGTIVCRGLGRINHVTERQDGTYVMALEPADADPLASGPVPLEAVDCATGDRQPIESVTINGEDGEVRRIERVAGRVFEVTTDAEGNIMALSDETGRDLIGSDYLYSVTFRSDGSLAAFGDANNPYGHFFTARIGVRDVTTGGELWRMDIDGLLVEQFFVGNTLVVLQAPLSSFEDVSGGAPLVADRLVVYNAASGALLDETAAPDRLVFVG